MCLYVYVCVCIDHGKGEFSLKSIQTGARRHFDVNKLRRGFGMNTCGHVFVIAAASFCFFISWAYAEDAPKIIEPLGSCATGGCHEDSTKFAYLHWKNFGGDGQCQECHVPEGNAHDFSLEEDERELCLRCHEDLAKKLKSEKVVHDPAQEGCTDCHNPHGGKVKALLNNVSDEDVSSICFECHDEELIGQKFKHGPAGLGACNQCHDPHASSIKPLLKAEQRPLCTSCHEEIGEAIESAEYVHDPVEEGCTDCHSPHSAKYEKVLLRDKRQLCNECHDDIVELAENAEVKHSPTTTGEQCITCHDPHAANASPNLRMPQPELCLSCHDKSVKAPDGELVNMKKWLEKNPVWHKPVKEDGCTKCHNPHGSENFRILKKSYPRQFYTEFDIKNFALCFSCHEKTLVSAKSTRSSTNFRDGDRNLHYLHVNRRKKSRSCRACHEVHAGQSPLLIRESTRFGNWMMPINYKKSETGGSCSPGCHKSLSYDRGQPESSREGP